jgi:hypothetical protein
MLVIRVMESETDSPLARHRSKTPRLELVIQQHWVTEWRAPLRLLVGFDVRLFFDSLDRLVLKRLDRQFEALFIPVDYETCSL